MFHFFAVVYTTGELTLKNIKDECQFENWAPILILRYNDKVVVPIFKSQLTANKFIRRNIPKDQLVGTIGMIEEDLELFKKRNWEIQWQDHPRKFIDRKDVEVDVEVLDLEIGFDLFTANGRPNVRV